VIQVCQEIKGGLGNFSCGEPVLDALVAKPEHSRTQLAGEGQAIGMAVEPIGGGREDLCGLLCGEEAITTFSIKNFNQFLVEDCPQPGL